MLLNNSEPGSLANRRVVVTGANGFLGTRLVRALLAQGANVLAADVQFGGESDSTPSDRLQTRQVDLGFLGAFEACLCDFQPDTLYHLASTPDGKECFEQVDRSIRGNLQLTLNALEGFCRAGGQLFIYGDSSKSYGNVAGGFHSQLADAPRSSYAIAKAAGWNYCQQYSRMNGIDVVSVRPTLIYGPGQEHNLITYVLDSVLAERESIVLDGGSQTRDPLFIDDAIDAFIRVCKRGASLAGRIVTLGGGREVSVQQIAAMVLEQMGRSDIDIVADESRRRATDATRSYCNNDEAREMLDWQPATTLEEGLQRTLQHLLASAR